VKPASLRSEIAECREWELRLHGGSAEMQKTAAFPRRIEWLVPFIMPLYGLLAWQRGAKFDSEWWIAVIPWWWTIAWGRLFPRAAPTDWEALLLPSRRGWFLARWSFRVPALLWLGTCTLSWVVLLGIRDDPGYPGPSVPVGTALLLAPFLLGALESWLPLQSAAFGGQSALPPLLGSILGLGFVGGGTVVLVLKGIEDQVALGVAALGGILGGGVLLLSLPSWITILRSAPGDTPGARIRSLVWIAFAGTAGVVPAQTLCILLLEREHLLDAGGAHPIVDLVLLPSAILGTVLLAADSLRLVDLADLGVEPRAAAQSLFARAAGARTALPASSDAGRGNRAAAWALYRGRWRNLQHPWLVFLPKLFWECRAPACGFIAMIAPVILSLEGGLVRILSLWLTVVFLLVIPSPLHLPASRRLHLLGADFAAVARHNLLWGTLLAVLPGALGAAVFLLLPGKLPARAIVGALLLCVGVLLLRQGPSALETLGALLPGRWARVALVLLATGGLAVGWSMDGPTALLVLGEAVFVLAGAAVVRDLRDPEGAGRRLEAAAADD